MDANLSLKAWARERMDVTNGDENWLRVSDGVKYFRYNYMMFGCFTGEINQFHAGGIILSDDCLHSLETLLGWMSELND